MPPLIDQLPDITFLFCWCNISCPAPCLSLWISCETWVTAPSADEFETRKSHSSRFGVKILWETSWLSFCLFSWVLCVAWCHSLIVLMVITNTVTRYIEVRRRQCFILPAAASSVSSASASSISHIGRCHFMPADYSQPPVPLWPITGGTAAVTQSGIHLCATVFLFRVSESSVYFFFFLNKCPGQNDLIWWLNISAVVSVGL